MVIGRWLDRVQFLPSWHKIASKIGLDEAIGFQRWLRMQIEREFFLVSPEAIEQDIIRMGQV